MQNTEINSTNSKKGLQSSKALKSLAAFLPHCSIKSKSEKTHHFSNIKVVRGL